MMDKRQFFHYEFLPRLKSLKSSPVYYIFGEENYLKDKILKSLLEKFVVSGTEDFDFITLYGDDCAAVNALEQLEMMPFMAKHRVVVLKNFDIMKTVEKNKISEYSKNPASSSILILVAEKNDNRISANKILLKNSISINCRKPYNASDMLKWFTSELSRRNIRMERSAAEIFINSIELDYLNALNELEKLIIFTKNNKEITLKDVRICLGSSKAQTVFELQKAIGSRDVKKSLKMLENMLLNNESPIYIVSMLNRFFLIIMKIIALRHKNIGDNEIVSQYLPEIYRSYRQEQLSFADNFNKTKIRETFSLLLDADIELKSLEPSLQRIILEKMIYKICAN